MAEVKTVPTSKPDIQITLTWDEAVAFARYLASTPFHPVVSNVCIGIDHHVCLEDYK
jgi:hypothetical protein